MPQQRRRDALLVAAVAQLAEELVDEVAAVGQDQHAAGARGLDEAERGDGLAGAGRVLEPEALGGVGVLGLLGELLLVARQLGVLLVPVDQRRLGLGAVELGLELRRDVLVVLVVLVGLLGRGAVEVLLVIIVVIERGLVVVVVLLVEVGLIHRLLDVGVRFIVLVAEDRGPRQRIDGAVAVRSARRLSEQGGQRARQRVHLMGGERRAVGELGLLLRQHALETQQQRELAPPGGRGDLQPGVQLRERLAERAQARGAGSERAGRLLAGVHERLARERLCARNVSIAGKGHSGHCGGFGHRGSVRQGGGVAGELDATQR